MLNSWQETRERDAKCDPVFMKKQNETNNQEPVIEDLTINEDQAAELKAGPSNYQYVFSGTYQNAAYNGR